MSGVKVRYNYPAIKIVQEKHANRLAWNAAQATKATLRRTAPRDSGLLAETFETKRTKRGEVTTWTVFTRVKYAIFQERGTSGTHARPGGVLRFKPKGSSVFVFAKHTRGVPALHFMRDAARSIRKRDFTSGLRPPPP